MPRGISLALPVALRRGHVMAFLPGLTNLGEFLIAGNGHFDLVGIRFARRIRASLHEIEKEFAEAIADLRLAPRTGPVSCELWLYSRYGTLRHFRVNDNAIAEVDLFGLPLARAKPAAVTNPVGKNPAGNDPVPVPEIPAAVPFDSRSHSIRYLVKWNAARRAGKKVWEMDGNEPGAIPGTDGKKKRRTVRGSSAGTPVPTEGIGTPREKGGIEG